MVTGLDSLLAGGLWIVLAVIGSYGVAVGGWRAMHGRAQEGLGLLVTGCISWVLFALLGVVMK
jgi:hypothetical protein